MVKFFVGIDILLVESDDFLSDDENYYRQKLLPTKFLPIRRTYLTPHFRKTSVQPRKFK